MSKTAFIRARCTNISTNRAGRPISSAELGAESGTKPSNTPKTMKASNQTRATILWNLEHNVQQAKSKKARQFAQERLDLYKASIERENQPTFNNPMERFAASIA